MNTLGRLVMLGALGLASARCAPGPALKSMVKNDSALAGSRELTVVGSDDDSFALANLLRKSGFKVTTAKEKSAATSDYVLEVGGCCPSSLGYNFCNEPLNVDLYLVPKGDKVYEAVVEDANDCPKRFYAAVAAEIATRWK